MSTERTQLDLDAIEARVSGCCWSCGEDVPALVAEVLNLRQALSMIARWCPDKATVWVARNALAHLPVDIRTSPAVDR